MNARTGMKSEVNKNLMFKNRPWIAIPGEENKNIKKIYIT
jgi:hypothetical protein